MANSKIRPATRKDIALLTDIIRGSFRDVAERFGLTKENCPKHASNCEADWIEKDMNRGVIYLILEDESQTSGCVAWERPSDELIYLERLAVLPDKRKRGFGKALIDYVFEEAKQAGARSVNIGIIAAQTELKKWYQKTGFIEGDTREFAHLPFLVTFMNYTLDANGEVLKQKQKGD
jgi:GNAT superfamily N-acetyltransferase